MEAAISRDLDIKYLIMPVDNSRTNLATMLKSTRQHLAVTLISMVLAVLETPAHSLMVNRNSEVFQTRFLQRFCRDFSNKKPKEVLIKVVILNNLSLIMLLDRM